jgi:hypothetical protein
LENLKGSTNLGDLGVNEKNIKTNLKEIGREGVEWINLAQDRDQ